MHAVTSGRVAFRAIALIIIVLSTSVVGVAQASAAGGLLAKWGSFGSGDGQFQSPLSVAVDSAGTVYVGDGANRRIQKFTSNGAFLGKWELRSGNGRAMLPSDVAIGPDGNLYVTTLGPFENGVFPDSGIQKYATNGALLAEWTLVPGSEDIPPGNPDSITVDGAGNVYVAFLNEIQKFTSSGGYLGKWGSYGTGDGQLVIAADLVTDAAGNVYVADGANYRVEKFTPNGAFLGKWGSEGSGDGQFGAWSSPSLYSVRGLAIDGSGNVYASDEYNHRIQKFTPDGAFLGKWGSKGRGDAQFNFPGSVATDAAGNVYVGDNLNGRIQKFDPAAAIAAYSEDERVTASKVARLVGGKMLLNLGCPAPNDCVGKVELVTNAGPAKSSGRSSATASRKRRHPRRRKSRRKVVIGKAGYKIPAEKHKTVRIVMNRNGWRLMRKRHWRPLRVQVRGRSLKSRSVLVKKAGSKRKKKGARTKRR